MRTSDLFFNQEGNVITLLDKKLLQHGVHPLPIVVITIYNNDDGTGDYYRVQNNHGTVLANTFINFIAKNAVYSYFESLRKKFNVR